ncbi:Arabinogalactan protein 15 [Quillaja saponaria]|uniref:Arabinogalactan protein 15 n=1 Tax=Quillaja saponaria TaxID=32244 RepID=A0AAD7PT29_QUISA|nr:Arabinogalactan protein 15 [Quillaja saponaria]
MSCLNTNRLILSFVVVLKTLFKVKKSNSLTMAFSKATLMAIMAVFLTFLSVIGAAHAAEAPAPSPTSPAVSISPSFGSACVAAVVALVVGSAIRI